MKSFKSLLLGAAVATTLLGGCSTPRYTAAGDEKIYDESADGSNLITTALTRAKKENKRLLLQFGANWSEGCHRLHSLLKSNPALAEEIKNDYVWLLIDLDQAHNEDLDMQYGNPTQFGYPALVIVDADGKQLAKTGADDFEDLGVHNPQKVLAFLKQWGPKK